MPVPDIFAILDRAENHALATAFLRHVTASEASPTTLDPSWHVLVCFREFPIAWVYDNASPDDPLWTSPPASYEGEGVTGLEIAAFRAELETHARLYLGLDHGAADTLVAGLAGNGNGTNGLQAALRFRTLAGELGLDR
jgi:hypothetical protein